MRISYNNLLKLLIDKGMKKGDLGIMAGLSTKTLAEIGKNEPISIRSILKICQVLHCDISDVITVVHDDCETEEKRRHASTCP